MVKSDFIVQVFVGGWEMTRGRDDHGRIRGRHESTKFVYGNDESVIETHMTHSQWAWRGVG